MADLPPLEYGKVVGRFLANTIDGPDIDDLPEFSPLSGTVTFTADAPKVLVAGAQPHPATYVQLPKHYECQLDEFGYLTWRGRRGVRLVAPNADTNPSDWTWRVSFELDYDGDRIQLAPYNFHVPAYVPGPDPNDPDVGSAGLIDLTLVSPVPASAGNAVVVGPRGEGLRIDGQVETYTQLPVTPTEGFQYIVKADGLLYIYHGAAGGWTPDGQGIVIRGATDWAGIGDKPATFPPTIGSTPSTAVAGNDPRLSDARTPTPHTHPAVQIADSTAVGRSVLTAADTEAARTAIATIADTDPRLVDARPPTAAGQAYDIAYKSHSGTRAAGPGNVVPEGLRIERAITVTSITYRGETAGTGNLVVELRRNGTVIAGTAATITAANHATDTTIAGTWVLAVGDRLTVVIATPDNPAGRGLQASLRGVTS
ncbi:hypothetical protein [Nocardia sp. NPDC058480]|uniref:hypothetical protein n=1 Tax=unclassified Nocardia TaxID=2637762 RepID=UPI0036577A23